MSQQPRVSEDMSTLRALLDALRDLHRTDFLYNAIGAFDRIEFTIAEQATEIARLKEEKESDLFRQVTADQLLQSENARLEAELAALRATNALKGGDALSNRQGQSRLPESPKYSLAPEVQASGATDAQREQDKARLKTYIDSGEEHLGFAMVKYARAALDRLAALPSRDEVLEEAPTSIATKVCNLETVRTGVSDADCLTLLHGTIQEIVEAALKSPPTLQAAKEA